MAVINPGYEGLQVVAGITSEAVLDSHMPEWLAWLHQN